MGRYPQSNVSYRVNSKFKTLLQNILYFEIKCFCVFTRSKCVHWISLADTQPGLHRDIYTAHLSVFCGVSIVDICNFVVQSFQFLTFTVSSISMSAFSLVGIPSPLLHCTIMQWSTNQLLHCTVIMCTVCNIDAAAVSWLSRIVEECWKFTVCCNCAFVVCQKQLPVLKSASNAVDSPLSFNVSSVHIRSHCTPCLCLRKLS